MKRILITGAGSYIGTSVKDWLAQYPDQYQTDELSMRDKSWKHKDFSSYDAVFHVAGVAHEKESDINVSLYYKINRDLAVETAKKAKKEGVIQFIFVSTMSVYGKLTGSITQTTVPVPQTHYGKAKLQAEILLRNLEDTNFKIAIIRPPMVYGKGCKGNYNRLSKLARKGYIFPDVKNQRSMIYIDNLSEFVKRIIDSGSRGIFFPQNTEYVCTSDMVQIIGKAYGKNIHMIPLPVWVINRISEKNQVLQKVFGSLVYEKELTDKDISDYCMVDFKTSIKHTEGIS